MWEDFSVLVDEFNMAPSYALTAWRYNPANATYVLGQLQTNANLWEPLAFVEGKHTFHMAPKAYVDRLPEGERRRERWLLWVKGTDTLRTMKGAAQPDLVRRESDGAVFRAEDEWPVGAAAGLCGVIVVRVDDEVTLPQP